MEVIAGRAEKERSSLRVESKQDFFYEVVSPTIDQLMTKRIIWSVYYILLG